MHGFEQLDLLPEAVLVLDPDRVVVHANDRAATVLGIAPEALGAHVGEAVTLLTDDGGRCADPVPPRGSAQRIAERVWSVLLPDGRVRPVAMAGRHLADGSVVLTWRPAGRRRAVDDARADVVAHVSHELRAPIATIRGFTRPLVDRWDELPDERRRTFVEAIDADAARVAELIDELLVVSRLDAGRMQLHREQVDVGALAAQVVAKARRWPHGRDRDMVVSVDGSSPVRVLADRGRIEQILTNLVDNALRHAPGARVDVDVDPSADGGVAVIVADDGPGIADELRDRVFAKFGRGRDSRLSGTGLGLHIARGLARAHGGDLTLAAGPDVGATFVLSIPGGREPSSG